MPDTTKAEKSQGLATYRVVIADDEEVIRDALSGLLEDHPRLDLVGSADNGRAAAQICSEFRPELVILDVRMECGGIEGFVAVRAVSPETKVVFYTAQADRRTRSQLMDVGAAAVFAKGAPVDLAAELVAIAMAAK